MNSSNDKSWPAIRRAWIERKAARTGSVKRREITAALGVSSAQASCDIQELLRQHPGCLSYDLKFKKYRWMPGHQPKLPLPALLEELSQPSSL